MATNFNLENTNSQDVANAIQGQEATAESNRPKASINLLIIAYPVVLLIVILMATAYFMLSRSDPDAPPSQRSATSANGQLPQAQDSR